MNFIYRIPSLTTIFLLFSIAAVINGQTIDGNFYPVVTMNEYAVVNATAIQPDGKILIAGSFPSVNGFQQGGVARLLTNGKIDESFQRTILVNGNYNGFVYDIKIQPDGKILIAGNLIVVNGQTRYGIARLNSDGSLDSSFTSVFSGFGYSVNDIELQPDGKILVAGNFPHSRNLVRLNSNGTIDGSFQNPLPSGSDSTALALQPDGRVLVAYQFFENVWKTKIVRLNSQGSLDESFTTVEVSGTSGTSGGSPDIDTMLLQADGKIIVGGSLKTIAGVTKNRLARINSNGTLDNSFLATADAAVFSLAMQDDGKILVGGVFSQINGTARKSLARLNSDGNLDSSLNASFPGIYSAIQSISLQPDGKIIIGGQFLNVGGALRYQVASLNSDGSLDNNFAFVLVGKPGLVSTIAPRADGKFFIGGSFSYVGDEYHNRLALINADGTLDKSFKNVNFGDNFNVFAVLPLPDNKVLVGGRLFAYAPDGRFYDNLVRFNADGTLDATFANTFSAGNNSVTSLALQPDGKILVGGLFSDYSGTTRNSIARLNPDGSLDTTFQNGMAGANNYGVSKIVLQPDGKILIGGYFTQINGVSRNRIARLNADGSLDTTFQNGMTGINNANNTASVLQIALQPDGKILVGGDFNTVNGTPQKYLARLNPDGSLDNSFSSNFTGTDGIVFSVAIERNNKILIGGSFNTVSGQARRGLAQLNADGSLDTSFPINFGTNFDTAYSLSVESNGNVLVGGSFGLVNNQSRTGLFRILNPRPSQFDFDGDGKSDVSVFRNGSWYINRSQQGFTGVNWGFTTDILTPADFDGDGRTDVAVFRDGNWYWINSSTNQFSAIQFGQSDDIPVPADFDGDGKADVSVFRPSNGAWYRLNSSQNNQFFAAQFGVNGDKPLVGDFDGDGKADLAVTRATNGSLFWYWTASSTNQFNAVQFGISTDIATPADYDGDGKTDVSVFRSSNGSWYRLNSSQNNQFSAVQFGQAGDIPVAADYDGDGKADVAVFRQGNWYRLNSATNSFYGEQFGVAADRPISAAFVR